MNDIELAKLGKIVERLGRMRVQSKVDYKKHNNVYAWGLADGVEVGYDMIYAFYEQVKNSLSTEKIDS